jgi:hypothetical protein
MRNLEPIKEITYYLFKQLTNLQMIDWDTLANMKDYARFNLCYGNYKWNKEWEGIRIEDWSTFKRFTEMISRNK